ncbi:MAG: hypothetical protein WBB52_01570 [Acidimicrobiales bacterium]
MDLDLLVEVMDDTALVSSIDLSVLPLLMDTTSLVQLEDAVATRTPG